MNTLAIDLETFSSVDIRSAGMYKYVQSDDFEILLCAYSINGTPVECFEWSADTAEAQLFRDVLTTYLLNPEYLKSAFNAPFEIACLSKALGVDLDASQWSCTMAKAAQVGLPLSLEQVASMLKLSEQKDTKGKALIKYFCMPCKATKANGGRTRNLPEHAPEKWEAFKEYCRQDVVTEQAVRTKIDFFEVPPMEVEIWNLDQKINRTGILIDPLLVRNAIRLDLEYKEKITAEAVTLTGLDNPNSVAQLKRWLETETGEAVESLDKKALPELLASASSDTVREMLRLRGELSKTSVKKYAAMMKARGTDNRIRGLLQYYGANRTGRWAGRLVQVQNLRQNHLHDLDLARNVVKAGDLDVLEMTFGNVPDTLSQLIRTAFVARPGSRFIVSDFSAIEARVIAWLSGEKWRLDVFNTHGKIYEASASQMFKVPIESVTKGSDLRGKGKIAELALGYQGGPGALIAMGALDMGLTEDDLKPIVTLWRNANKKIVRYWYDVQDAAIEAVDTGATVILRNVKFYTKKNIFFIELPSGRRLCYLRPAIRDGKYGKIIIYEGMDQTTKKWGRQDTYGGKLVENIVQAVARDLLAHALIQLDKAGFSIVMHVHDEVVIEEPVRSAEEVSKIMATGPAWAKGLPLTADSYETFYYKKD